MKERKVIRVLKTFSVAELNGFRKFLISPYFNSNERFIALFDLIDDCLRNEKDFYELSNQEIWEKVHGNLKDFTEIRLRKMFSDLFALSEEYMLQSEFKEDKSFRLTYLFKAYKNRRLKEIYSTVVDTSELTDKLHLNKNAEFYLHKYMHQKAILEFNIENQIFARNENLDEKLNIEEISYNIDVFYIAEKLKYYCNVLSYNRSYKINKKINGIEIILKLAQSDVFKDYPPIAVYYTISKTITDEVNEEHYYKLKELIDRYLHLFNEKEAKDIFEAALNYCVTKGNKGLAEFEKEAFILYKYGLDHNLMFDEDQMLPPTYFRNIVFSALRNNSIEWASEFIENYSEYLSISIRESNVNFSLARLEWYKKDYKKVIQYLAYTEYTEVFQALLSRTLLLLSYYELKENESLESLLNSFKLYLDREKSLNKERKLQYYNLIKYTRTLLNLTKKDKEKLLALKEEIEKAEAVVNKAWLLEKVGEKMTP